VRTAALADYKFISIKVDPATYRIAFAFHNDDSDAYSLTLCHDGGGKEHKRRGRDNLMVQTASLMRLHKWVAAVSLQREVRLRQFEPEWNSRDKLWIISLRPSFELKAVVPEDIPPDAYGIYRYVADDEVVYIGKGAIRERALSPERRDWVFDRIEYSVVEDDSKRLEFESWWLAQFEGLHGKLPAYNRIGGRRQ